MNTLLSERRILIAGGTSGIGLATSQYCIEKNASVFILGQNHNKLSSAVKYLKTADGSHCDVRLPLDCKDSVDKAKSHMGGIDTLIFCAGVGTILPISDLTFEDYRAMIEVNLLGAFNMCQSALPELKKSNHADIILLGSRAGRYAFEGGTGYCAAKFGMQGFAEALYLDVISDDISVSLIAPGTVDTGFANVEGQSWHLQAEDVAKAIGDCLTSHSRVNMNWIEMRPSRRCLKPKQTDC